MVTLGKAEENKRKKRNSLLKQSYKLFTTKGISDTSITDIANSAGVAKGTFYFYFKDKQDLIYHLIARKAEALLVSSLEVMKDAEKENPDMPVEEKLVTITDALLSDLAKDPALVKFLDKNLSLGFYVKAYTDESLITKINVRDEYYRIINSRGDRWRDDQLMLYTIIELISSTLHTVIVSEQPCSLTEYKPYLFDCIRAIVEVFREK